MHFSIHFFNFKKLIGNKNVVFKKGIILCQKNLLNTVYY